MTGRRALLLFALMVGIVILMIHWSHTSTATDGGPQIIGAFVALCCIKGSYMILNAYIIGKKP